MGKMTEEHTFNPNAMEQEIPVEDMDLGEYEFEVDMLEAQAAKDEEEEEESPEETSEDEDSEEEETDESAEEGEEETPSEDEEEGDEELEDEEEEDDEEEEEPTVDDELAVADENPTVPRERLNQANRKRQEETERANRLEQELATVKAQMEEAADTAGISDIDPSAFKEAAEKALDGDTDAFSKMLAEQFASVTENATKSQQAAVERAKKEALQEFRMEQIIQERQEAAKVWEQTYPALDPESDSLNSDALEEAIQLTGMFENKGYSPTAAMERAVTAVAVNFGLETTADANSEPAPKPKSKPKVTIKKGTKKAVKQPPAAGQGGAEKTKSPGIDPSAMTQDEWNALPDSVRDQYLTGGA